jgi:hypothetical protein
MSETVIAPYGATPQEWLGGDPYPPSGNWEVVRECEPDELTAEDRLAIRNLRRWWLLTRYSRGRRMRRRKQHERQS